MATKQTMREYIERLEREVANLQQEIRIMQNSHISELEKCQEAAFDAGVQWTLQQDENTLNKLRLTQEQECCEGGPLTAGCFHDNCTGSKRYV